MRKNNSNGKGSRPRGGYTEKFRDNWDKIFKKSLDKPKKK